jgi:hypothetical protein
MLARLSDFTGRGSPEPHRPQAELALAPRQEQAQEQRREQVVAAPLAFPVPQGPHREPEGFPSVSELLPYPV